MPFKYILKPQRIHKVNQRPAHCVLYQVNFSTGANPACDFVLKKRSLFIVGGTDLFLLHNPL